MWRRGRYDDLGDMAVVGMPRILTPVSVEYDYLGIVNRCVSLDHCSGSSKLSPLHLPHQSGTAFFVLHTDANFDCRLGSVPVEAVQECAGFADPLTGDVATALTVSHGLSLDLLSGLSRARFLRCSNWKLDLSLA